MGKLSRTKGASGERELAALLSKITGCNIRRRVRQHEFDSDLEGLPFWTIECKRAAAAPLATVANWWLQAEEQARHARQLPLLCYRADRQPWRCVWPAGLHLQPLPHSLEIDFGRTLTSDLETWWRLCKGIRHHF